MNSFRSVHAVDWLKQAWLSQAAVVSSASSSEGLCRMANVTFQQHCSHSNAPSSSSGSCRSDHQHSHLPKQPHAHRPPRPQETVPARQVRGISLAAAQNSVQDRWPQLSILKHSTPQSCSSQHPHQFQLFRHYGHPTPKEKFQFPPEVQVIVDDAIAAHIKIPVPHIPAPAPSPMQPDSHRVGCIAIKAGMTQEWDEHGVRVPLTVLWVDECEVGGGEKGLWSRVWRRRARHPDIIVEMVVGVNTPERNGRWALQVGAGYTKQKSMSISRAGFFLTQGVPFKKKVHEWPVSQDAVLPIGTHITSAHYVPGQRVDVTGWTKFKGFQGVMKRWGFKGLPATRGVSLAHRSPGAIGGRQDPGKVWKGQKLPGHMGNERRTVQNCMIYKIDSARNLLYVRGQVPGPVGRFVFLRDAVRNTHEFRSKLAIPFPSFCGDPAASPIAVFKSSKDPYLMYRSETDYFPINWKKGD